MDQSALEALIPAAIGLLGVVIGAFVTSYATERVETRRSARTAARLAGLGLQRWADAIAYMKRAPDRLAEMGDEYDAYLAIEVRALEKRLNNVWWNEQQQVLGRVSTSEQWKVLKAASNATDGVLRIISTIGDAGKEALMRRAKIRTSSARQRRALRSASPPVPEDPESDDPGKVLEWARAKEEEFDRKEAEFDEDTRISMEETRAMIDHRLFMVRDVVNSLVSAEGKVNAGVAVCNQIAEANSADFRTRFRRS